MVQEVMMVERDWWDSTDLLVPKDYNCALGSPARRKVEYWGSLEFVLRGGIVMP